MMPFPESNTEGYTRAAAVFPPTGPLDNLRPPPGALFNLPTGSIAPLGLAATADTFLSDVATPGLVVTAVSTGIWATAKLQVLLLLLPLRLNAHHGVRIGV